MFTGIDEDGRFISEPWEGPPPPQINWKQKTYTPYLAMSQTLKKNPGIWGLVVETEDYSLAYRAEKRMMGYGCRAWRGELVGGGWEVWAVWVEPEGDESHD